MADAARCSLRLVVIGDVVGGNGARVAGANAADVGEGEEVGDAGQRHAGAVQVHLRQVNVSETLQA